MVSKSPIVFSFVHVNTAHILTHTFVLHYNQLHLRSCRPPIFPIPKPAPVGQYDHQASSHHHGRFHSIVPT